MSFPPRFYADAMAVAQVDAARGGRVLLQHGRGCRPALALFTAGFPGTVSFAVKSNPSREVVQTLADAGLTHWDVASVHEMALVHSVQPTRISTIITR